MEKEIVAQAPRGAIPRALCAVALMRDAIVGEIDADEALAAAERQLWLSWCSVQRVRADRDAGRGRAA